MTAPDRLHLLLLAFLFRQVGTRSRALRGRRIRGSPRRTRRGRFLPLQSVQLLNIRRFYSGSGVILAHLRGLCVDFRETVRDCRTELEVMDPVAGSVGGHFDEDLTHVSAVKINNIRVLAHRNQKHVYIFLTITSDFQDKHKHAINSNSNT